MTDQNSIKLPRRLHVIETSLCLGKEDEESFFSKWGATRIAQKRRPPQKPKKAPSSLSNKLIPPTNMIKVLKGLLTENTPLELQAQRSKTVR